jgi:RNA polymerase sigma factor (sigma-70 family)
MPGAQFGKVLRHIHFMAAGSGGSDFTDRQFLDSFSIHRDEAAFSALISRHGPMVWRVCRRVLQHEQDAEDAFQAVFLVLAQRSASIRKREALAEWLHGVSYRTAMKAKRTAARRRNHEARLQVVASAPIAKPSWDDVQSVLDEEIQRLPKAFRAAFVLCILEGKTGPQAATELDIPEGTVSSRVTRARQLLRGRLSRRGIELSTLLAALSVATSANSAVPAIFASAKLLVAAGGSGAATIPPRVAALAGAVTRAMFISKAKVAVFILMAAGLMMGVAHQVLSACQKGMTAQAPSVAEKGVQPKPKDKPEQPKAKDEQESITYSGRVLDALGKPVPGAKLYMAEDWGYLHEPSPSPEYATAGVDGRFSFSAPKAKFGEQPTVVAAVAANHGVGWLKVPTDGKKENLAVRLVNDDVPVTGQIVDLEGKPVAGATLRLMQINAAPGHDLKPWLEACRNKRGLSLELEQQYLKEYTIAVPLEVTTDSAGGFKMTGIGSNRLIRVQLDGPTITSQHLCILTRPGEPIQVTEHEGDPEFREPSTVTTYYGANLRHVAAPCKPIVGVVRDKDTKKPLAGITVRSYALTISRGRVNLIKGFDLVRTTTDAQGRYRLTGMPKLDGNKIVAIPDKELPYVAAHADVPESPGLDAVSVDIELKRGAWIEGKITDKVTGKPFKGRVEYFALVRNPNLRDYPGFDGTAIIGLCRVETKEDGSYRVTRPAGAWTGRSLAPIREGSLSAGP